ncbi:hypothetical protein PANT_22d00227 [Moesziomyces antarcticus T-34]|uniref:Uncharacterized protein n=1 Tax=Pseudozyma antarctica (strain T-34) TaxID=1151754 RepID=M9MG94_PSEA3|nr:hypothetical protein PANT_22d00227 [Moesziomyces antarcticus T-34]
MKCPATGARPCDDQTSVFRMLHNGIKLSKEEQSSKSNSNPCKRIFGSAISAQNPNFDCASEGDAAHHPGSTIFEATRGTGQVETAILLKTAAPDSVCSKDVDAPVLHRIP